MAELDEPSASDARDGSDSFGVVNHRVNVPCMVGHCEQHIAEKSTSHTRRSSKAEMRL